MGGTLDNGIYLPDQGERNCYNGLKNNWDTLDNLIETVQALSSAGLTREIVNSLPTENIKTNVIYMLRNSQQSGDLYDEYMYINNAWEPIGTSATEMDNYYTKSETNALPAVASGITASKVTGYDSHVANTEVHITAAERSTWNGKQNALDTDQTAAVNSGVNATKVTGYDTHVADTVVHVTASDKTAWNAKQDGLSQAQLNAVNSGVTDTKVTGYDTHVGDTSAHVSSSDRTAWNGKQDALTQTQLDNIAAVPDKANSADLATVATSGSYTDLINAPTIPTVNNATLTIQKNGTDVATFTANASSNVTANLSIPTDTSDLTNGAGFLTQHNPIDNELSVSSENAVQNKVVTTALNGKAASSHTHAAGDINTGTFNIARIPDLDASKITSGTIDIARLPKGSLERLVKVADQAARYALTTDDVQLGDTVQQLDTGVMYVVTDETKLDSADGYTEFTAGSATSVPWSGVTGKPSTFTPSSHTHGNITNDGKVGTAANKPLITGTGGAVQAGSFGNTANTFCEGNDSRLSDARTPVAHTHTKSDVTDLLNSNFIPSANNSYDLGSSSYQWNNLYAKNYYYNGVAWGLDKANTWTGVNTYTGNTTIDKNSGNPTTPDETSLAFIAGSNYIFFRTKGSSNFKSYNSFLWGGHQGSGYSGEDRLGHLKIYRASDIYGESGENTPDISFSFIDIALHFKKVNITDNVSFKNDGTINACYPAYNNATDLGTSTNKWKSIYSDSYYYGTTAWGLDKANEWTADQTIASNRFLRVYGYRFQVKNAGMALGTVPSSNQWTGMQFVDKNNTAISEIVQSFQSNGNSLYQINVYSNEANSEKRSVIAYTYSSANNVNALAFSSNLLPTDNNAYNLGVSTQKWKTLNGVNPGALSLPNVNAVTGSSNTQLQDISGDLVQDQYFNCYFTPRMDGWAYIALNCSNATIRSGFSSYTVSVKTSRAFANALYSQPFTKNENAWTHLVILFPVTANKEITLEYTFTGFSVTKGYVIPCLGNV